MPKVFVVGAAAYVFGDTLALCGRLRWEKEVDSANGKKSYLMADQGDERSTDLESSSDLVKGEASTPPTVVPEDEKAASRKRRPKWLVPLVVAVVVVVVVAGLVGWHLVESHRHDSALESCNQVARYLRGKTGSAQLAKYQEASGVKVNQVKDAKTVTDMSRSVKAAGGLKPPTIQCKASMFTSELNTEASKAKKLDGEYAAVSKSAKAVTASRDAKTLEGAKTALNAKKDEASKLLGDSDGKAADNATRDDLQTAMDQAGQIKGDKAKAYQEATNSLQVAIDRVNASMQAKSQADQQAAAQAAQTQASQQTAKRSKSSQQGLSSSHSRGRRGYTPSRPTTSQRGGGGGGSAPTPATPQEDHSNWRERLQNGTVSNGGKPVCQKGQACGIG